jgi:hypothetical protein
MAEQPRGFRRDLVESPTTGNTQIYSHPDGPFNPSPREIVFAIKFEIPKKIMPGGLAETGDYMVDVDGDDATIELHEAKVRDELGDGEITT